MVVMSAKDRRYCARNVWKMDAEVKQRNRRRKRAKRMQAQREINREKDSGDEDIIPEKPPRPPNRRKKSKEPLCEEDIIDGFSILQFKTYEDLEVNFRTHINKHVQMIIQLATTDLIHYFRPQTFY